MSIPRERLFGMQIYHLEWQIDACLKRYKSHLKAQNYKMADIALQDADTYAGALSKKNSFHRGCLDLVIA